MSWFQREATISLELIAPHVAKEESVVDVGAGASTLVDGLLAREHTDVTLLDIADNALAVTRKRMADVAGKRVSYVVTDVTWWKPERKYGLWHDRAVFHFLTQPEDRAAYRKVLGSAVGSGGQVVIAAIGLDGPERCSGLPVHRYSSATLAAAFDGLLRLEEERHEIHKTPTGAEQSFVYGRLRRV